MSDEQIFKKQGTFSIGCNYWASHAGTGMWSEWRPDVVEEDFRKLSEAGMEVLRVFPIWSDFQPITRLYSFFGKGEEVRFGEEPFPDDEAGNAGISPVMIARFGEFAALADKYKLRLIVGLVTGWMSGRLYVPPALAGRNPITDPVSICWQVRLVRYFVKRFRELPAIIAWDLGNECNCMGEAPTREAAWLWTSSIADAIKAFDSERPVISGMHAFSPAGEWPGNILGEPFFPGGTWTMQDQGELTDILTVHPYPVFTPYCDREPINSIRTILHAPAEAHFYSDIGRKPCLVEEIGTLGPMVSSEKASADFARASLFACWADGCIGWIWWCAFDMENQNKAPYDWSALERELGLYTKDGAKKPVLAEISGFGNFIKSLPFKALPPRISEGVCILSRDQDYWGVAFSSYILAKQAGFELQFQYENQQLKEAMLYILPCIRGGFVISRRMWKELLNRVAEGAVLYISYDGGFLSNFEEAAGIRIEARYRRSDEANVAFGGVSGCRELVLDGQFKLMLDPVRCEVLGSEKDGNAIFTCAEYGKGKIYFLGLPLESAIIKNSGTFHGPQAQPYWAIYKHISRESTGGRVISKASPMVGVTEHPLDDTHRIIVMVNYSPDVIENEFHMASGWCIDVSYYGAKTVMIEEGLNVRIPANDAVVFSVRRK